MSIFIKFLVLGLGAGALYGLLAQGLVVIYRGSSVINFSQGAIATLAGAAHQRWPAVCRWRRPVRTLA